MIVSTTVNRCHSVQDIVAVIVIAVIVVVIIVVAVVVVAVVDVVVVVAMRQFLTRLATVSWSQSSSFP